MIKKQPKLSVVMSVYNERKEWLRLSIESILNQTFFDFEFIIVMDKPGEHHVESILEEYKAKDTRVIIVKNKQNLGLTKSLNIGLKMARGRYIARMDADDISNLRRLEEQYKYLEENPDHIACGTCVYFINEIGFVLRKYKKPKLNSELLNYQMLYNPIMHPTLFFRNISILYDEHFIYAQDYEFVSRLSEYGKLHNLQKALLKYRRSSTQITNHKRNEQEYYGNLVRWNLLAKAISVEPETNIRKIDISDILEKITHQPRRAYALYYYLFFMGKFNLNNLKIYFKEVALYIHLKMNIKLLSSLVWNFKKQL